jgi:hypothetical protein
MQANTIHYRKGLPIWDDVEDVGQQPSPDPLRCHFEIFGGEIFGGGASYGTVALDRGIKVIMNPPGQGEAMLGAFLLPSPPKYGSAKAWREPLYGPQLFRLQVESAKDDALIATAPELAAVVDEINQLAFQDERDDFGLLRPSFHALTECLKFILSLVRETELLRPSEVTTDRNGDIRIAWTGEQERQAELVFPSDADESAYLYYSSPTQYETEQDLNPRTVAKRIRWAVDGR